MTNAFVTGFDRQTAHAFAELSGVADGLEAVFLDAGSGLGEAVTCWDTIAQTFTALTAQFERTDMRACIDDLTAALAVAAELGATGQGDTVTRLSELEGALTAMASRLVRLSRTVAEVKLVALNAKVEAAHLDDRSTDFSVFTREIDRLAADAARELAVLSTELHALTAETSEARQAQAGFAERHGGALLSLTHRLDDSLHTLNEQRRQVAEAAASIGRRSRLAGDKVGQAVMALQIGDITRQRTEHVAEAMTVLGGLCVPPPDVPAADTAQAISLVASLQAHQLEQTAADLLEQVGQVSISLADLAGETEAITSLGRDSFGGGDGSFLTDLGREIGQVERLLEEYATALTRTGETMNSVCTAVATMVAHVEAIHSIEADLKIMALNASFKCSRLGDRGRTLSVVAQSLRQLATRTEEDAETLMSGLQTAQAQAEILADNHNGHDGEAIGLAVTRLREATERLSAIGTEQAAALNVLETDSHRAQMLLRGGCEHIAVSDGFARRLRKVAQGLIDIADSTPIDTTRIEELKNLVLSRLSGNYTMASERALHDLFGAAATAADAPPRTEPTETEIDDLLF